VISLTDFSMLLHDVVMMSYCCQRYAECLVTTLFQQDSAPAHRAVHVLQLNCCVKKRQTFLGPTCGLQTAQISVVWITRSGLSCSIVSIVYHRQIHSVDELKRRLIDVWCGLQQSIFNETTDQWGERHRACVHAKRHFKAACVNWQCWFCPYLLHLLWLVSLLHL